MTKEILKHLKKDQVGIRISPYGVFNDMAIYPELDETYDFLSAQLHSLGLAYIHIVDHSSMGAPEVPSRIKNKIRGNFKGALILSGGYDAKKAQLDLEKGRCELVAFGRPFISNPDLVSRIKKGISWNTPDFATFYTPGPKGYIDYPRHS